MKVREAAMTQRRRIMIAATAVLVVCCCLAVWYGCRVATEARKRLRMQVVEALKTGQVVIGPTGVVKLPPRFGSASEYGEVYASLLPNGQLFVAFKTWTGKGYNMEGLLYCSQPLTPGNMVKDYYGNNTVQVGPVDLTIEQQINSNWYQVSYRLD
jgi:hypothetical protein